MAYKAKEKKGKKDDCSLARARFEKALERDKHNRDLFIADMKFRAASPDHPEWQWHEQDVKNRQADPNGSRPCLVINKTQEHVHQVTNEGRQNRPSIKVLPVDDKADKATAEIFNGIIRHIETQSDAEVAYDTALDNAVTGGVGYFRFVTDYIDDESFDQDIFIRRVRNPLTVIDDPDIQMPDGSDRKYCFIIEQLTKEEYENAYGKDHPISWDFAKDAAYQHWINEDGVTIAEYWYYTDEDATLYLLPDGTTTNELPEGFVAGEDVRKRSVKRRKVCWELINGVEVLEKREWAGRYIPLCRVVGNEFDIEGKIYTSGLVRNIKDPQRMYNYHASLEVESIALAPKAPFVGAAGQFEGHEQRWAAANRVNFAYLEYEPVVAAAENGQQIVLPPPKRMEPPMPQMAIIQAKLAAADDMKSTTGQYNASLGQQSNETSGRAILARQREGDVATYHYLDNQARALRFGGKILVDLIPHIYDTARIARIMGEDGQSDTARIDPEAPQAFQEVQDEFTGQVEKIYNLGVGRYDVTVVVGPSFATKRQEAAASMIEAVRANPALMQIAGDLIVEAQDWPGSDRFAKRLKAAMPPNLQEADEDGDPKVKALEAQLQQMQQAIQQMQAAPEMRKLDIDQFNAETNRMKAEADVVKAQTDAMKAQAETAQIMPMVQQLAMSIQQVAEGQAYLASLLQPPQEPLPEMMGQETMGAPMGDPMQEQMPAMGMPEQL